MLKDNIDRGVKKEITRLQRKRLMTRMDDTDRGAKKEILTIKSTTPDQKGQRA